MALPVPSIVPRGFCIGWGGFRRRGPVGGWAKGMALNFSTFPDDPTMVAAGDAIVTVGAAGEAGAARPAGERDRSGRTTRRRCIASGQPYSAYMSEDNWTMGRGISF